MTMSRWSTIAALAVTAACSSSSTGYAASSTTAPASGWTFDDDQRGGQRQLLLPNAGYDFCRHDHFPLVIRYDHPQRDVANRSRHAADELRESQEPRC